MPISARVDDCCDHLHLRLGWLFATLFTGIFLALFRLALAILNFFNNPKVLRIVQEVQDDVSGSVRHAEYYGDYKLDGPNDEIIRARLEEVTTTLESWCSTPRRYLVGLLGLHVTFCDAMLFQQMARSLDRSAAQSCTEFLKSLVTAEVIKEVHPYVFALHPSVSKYFSECYSRADAGGMQITVDSVFVDLLARLADAEKDERDYNALFMVQGGTFRRALEMATTLQMDTHQSALLQLLAAYEYYSDHLTEAREHYIQLATLGTQSGRQDRTAIAYHQLGIIAQRENNFDIAIEWYEKALAIDDNRSDPFGPIDTMYQIATVADDKGKLDLARSL